MKESDIKYITLSTQSSDIAKAQGQKHIKQQSGAKLAPFNSGGVCQNSPAKPMMPCSKFYLGVKNFLPDIKKKGQNIFPHINQLN